MSVEDLSTYDYFSEQGELAKNIEGFKFRPQQLDMASAVERTIHDASTLVVEAGTGVGKTFAYLVPAMLSGMKVIVSTGTRHLQDQLYYTDLPVLQNAIGLNLKAAILKGRSNYLCKYRFEHFEYELPDYPKFTKPYIEIKEWSKLTNTGDVAEVNEVSEQSSIWSHVTSTRDNCLGGECPDYNKCHVLKARKRAQEADLVVINHHLLGADLVLKEEGFGELLPSVDVFVIDEAHQFADILPNFFGQSIGSRQLQDLINDISKELTQVTSSKTISKSYYAVLDYIQALNSALVKKMHEQRSLWQEILGDKNVDKGFTKLISSLLILEERLVSVAGESPGLAQCYKRLSSANGLLDDFLNSTNKTIQWVELGRRRFRLGSIPLDAAVPFQKATKDFHCSWIYTSATLTARLSFNHFIDQLGLQDAECVMCDSPFDYQTQSRLYLPDLNCQPNETNYTDEVIARALPLLKASEGNAFMLFTSHRALNCAASLMKDEAFNVLVQGDAAKRELLKQFQSTENCVLLGTQSFWEGVDVKGHRLRLVIIDKLPFMSPGDPLVQARSRLLQEAGENPFMIYQIPQAILNLKQGVGRLIRGEQDRGVVVLMDPRIKTKAYGKSFLKSLPAMTISEDELQIISFLHGIKKHEITCN
ncbi:MAG: ATP-dependent DNA helicase [Pseudomonadota bacterium]